LSSVSRFRFHRRTPASKLRSKRHVGVQRPTNQRPDECVQQRLELLATQSHHKAGLMDEHRRAKKGLTTYQEPPASSYPDTCRRTPLSAVAPLAYPWCRRRCRCCLLRLPGEKISRCSRCRKPTPSQTEKRKRPTRAPKRPPDNQENSDEMQRRETRTPYSNRPLPHFPQNSR
jgi:hypothetical protein